MEKFVRASSIPIRIVSYGEENTQRAAVALLHGYLETLDIWDGIAKKLGKHIYTIALDLPGHGLSGASPNVNTMELMADVLADICTQLKIERLLPIGHSMGGYAALAFAQKYPQYTSGLCLFHSTPNADTPQKRLARNTEIDLIQAGKRDAIIHTALPKLFAPQNVKRMQAHIDEMTCNLQFTKDAGIIACLKGMQQRSDMNDFLKGFTKPLLFVFGKNDQYISAETAQAMADKFPQAVAMWFENSGHCAFLEEPDKAAEALAEFVKFLLPTT
jgi:pimeloyl-ACP methyl ester carboxylesterase